MARLIDLSLTKRHRSRNTATLDASTRRSTASLARPQKTASRFPPSSFKAKTNGTYPFGTVGPRHTHPGMPILHVEGPVVETGKQITAHITSAERASFEEYARTFHLDAAGLLALLFAREMRVGRLGDLIDKDASPRDIRDTKVTFRLNPTAHAALLDFVKVSAGSVSLAGAAMIRAELNERLLERLWLTRNESL